MSATAVAAISALTGLALQILRTREELRLAALASGEITAEDLATLDAQLSDQVQRLYALLPPGTLPPLPPGAKP